MKRGMKILLAAVSVMAALLMGLRGAEIARDTGRLRELRQQLSVSRAAWEDTAARKEELQAELKKVQEDLKEANLTLQESTVRAEELRQDLAELEAEIRELKEK